MYMCTYVCVREYIGICVIWLTTFTLVHVLNKCNGSF